ncbi:probable phage protein [Hahella chejuensis KCTC 2396]|uniref:Probable phage protein n=1 Tax=Hahella chejuensis (strain KCTC 2396) TaxID=349521 RepID=Q2SAL1_HAHCH|nr:discoidin domain-containing protein [Hahella chejuensis]ABC32313.1 probable phage protein [Hahella chejuensis KCTC 2396]
MAYESGTAGDYVDLLMRLYQFVTQTMTPVEQRWRALRWIGYKRIFCSSELGGYEAFRGFDADSASEWLTAQSQAAPSHLGLELVRPLEVRAFTLRGAGKASRSPKSFTLEGSDDGEVWTAQETWNDQSWSNAQFREYSVSTPSIGAKTHWRILIHANNGDWGYSGLRDFDLLETLETSRISHGVPAQLILQGPGLSGNDAVFVGIETYASPTTDIFNWRLAGFSGFVEANGFSKQPGASPMMGFPVWNAAMPYWFVANGQRIVCVVKVDTSYMTFYLGKFLPYATPGQFPYPLLAAGMTPTDALTRYSDGSLVLPYKGNRANFKFRFIDGEWLQPESWPWNNSVITRDTEGHYPLMPIVLNDPANTYGELDGVYFVPGFANAVESTVVADGLEHLVVQDVFRTGVRDYFALRLA